MEEKWKCNEDVRAALEKYIAANDVTHAELADRLHVSATRVTKYLKLADGRVPEPDMPRVENAARNFLRHAGRRSALRESLFENSVSTAVAGVLRLIRRTGDIGLIHSPGGYGKTSGAELFSRDNQNTLLITARQYACGSNAIAAMLFNEYVQTFDARWPRTVGKMIWLEEQLRGSECLIIADNAQRFHISAFKMLMDLHDATGCALGLIGNTEVLATLRAHDPEGQLITRIGIVQKIRVKGDEELTAEKLIGQFAAESGRELIEQATDVLARGNARSLKKQLCLAREIYNSTRGEKDWAKSFQSAGTKLVKPENRRTEP